MNSRGMWWLKDCFSRKGYDMSKKNDKRLCWNCDGGISPHFEHCPYCGVSVALPADTHEATKDPAFSFPPKNLTSMNPIDEQSSYLGHPFQKAFSDERIPPSPYANSTQKPVTDEEWKQAMESEETPPDEFEEPSSSSHKGEMIALLLLLPGVVFFLFGLVLLLFSHNGVLTLQWNQSFAYFYFLGALPLLILGWKSLR